MYEEWDEVGLSGVCEELDSVGLMGDVKVNEMTKSGNDKTVSPVQFTGRSDRIQA